jgi:hypothetical protein
MALLTTLAGDIRDDERHKCRQAETQQADDRRDEKAVHGFKSHAVHSAPVNVALQHYGLQRRSIQ